MCLPLFGLINVFTIIRYFKILIKKIIYRFLDRMKFWKELWITCIENKNLSSNSKLLFSTCENNIDSKK
ncbi:hypothetical protein BH23THE1_BH23THE1_26470 [soil metagenome]